MADFFARLAQPQVLFIAAILLFTFTLLRRLRLRRRLASSPASTSRPNVVEPTREPVNLRGTQEDLAVRLHETFRELSARLDMKIYVLDELLHRAEAKIAELEKLMASSPDRPRASREAPAEKDEESNPTKELEATSAGSTPDPLIIEPERGSSNLANQSKHAPEMEPSPDKAGGRFAAIYSLADQGLTPAEIGARTRHPIGEVELILSLRRRREQETNARKNSLG